MAYRSKLMPPREVLVWLYATRRLSDTQIGQLCGGASPSTVANWRRKLDIHRSLEPLPQISKAVLEDLYVAQGLTIKQVGEKVGRSAWTVHQALRAYRIPIRPRGHGPSPRRLPPGRIPDDEELARIYDAGHGLAELARRYGVSQATIRDRVIAGGGHIRPKGRPPAPAGPAHRRCGGAACTWRPWLTSQRVQRWALLPGRTAATVYHRSAHASA